ncbi:MAG: hypothetical protein H7099_04420 [Gemmatimonadaceae bacterium]|nr:hypothetical protein [Gemmatimonadaceae bacterium]
MSIATLVAAIPLVAQQSTVPVADPWAPFLGCWSTSSNGVVGPMVCVVPGDSAKRVEFLTIDRDSVSGRTIIDASGTPRAQVRGECAGFEEARWSSDQRRLYIHADYRCRNGSKQRGDAIVAMTHSDAFTQVEGVITGRETRTTTVNFIVQLDTTIFPAEVKRRLSSYRTLSRNDGELETMAAVSASDITDAATNLDPAVVQAWLADRGDRPDLTAKDLRALRVASDISLRSNSLVMPNARGRAARYLGVSYQQSPDAILRWQGYRGEQFPTNILVTPAMVNFSYPGMSRRFTWGGWP